MYIHPIKLGKIRILTNMFEQYVTEPPPTVT